MKPKAPKKKDSKPKAKHGKKVKEKHYLDDQFEKFNEACRKSTINSHGLGMIIVKLNFKD